MKTIAQLPPLEFLRRANDLRTEGARLLHELRFTDTVNTLPTFTGHESEEERMRMAAAQQQKNLDALMTHMLADKPEATLRLLELVVVPEDGETISGAHTWDALMCMLSDGDFIRFLSSLARSGLMKPVN